MHDNIINADNRRVNGQMVRLGHYGGVCDLQIVAA